MLLLDQRIKQMWNKSNLCQNPRSSPPFIESATRFLSPISLPLGKSSMTSSSEVVLTECHHYRNELMLLAYVVWSRIRKLFSSGGQGRTSCGPYVKDSLSFTNLKMLNRSELNSEHKIDCLDAYSQLLSELFRMLKCLTMIFEFWSIAHKSKPERKLEWRSEKLSKRFPERNNKFDWKSSQLLVKVTGL